MNKGVYKKVPQHTNPSTCVGHHVSLGRYIAENFNCNGTNCPRFIGCCVIPYNLDEMSRPKH